jgi:hypothetical protein
MNSLNRTVLAAAIAVGGVGMVRADAFFSANAGAQRLTGGAEEHWKYPHMHHALGALAEARKDLDDAEDIFHGHKQDAIDHVEGAMKEIRTGLKEKNDETIEQLPAPSRLGEYPHMHHALERLKFARKELDNADAIFGGHRDDAIEHTDKAIKQIEEGLGG